MLILDGFGLTRLTDGGDVLHEPAVAAPPGNLSHDAKRSRYFVERVGKVNLLIDPESLAIVQRVDADGVLHPGGEHVIDLAPDGTLQVVHLTPSREAWSHSLAIAKGRRLEPIELGGDVAPRQDSPRPLALAVDTFLAYLPRDETVPDDRPILRGGRVRWRKPHAHEGLVCLGTFDGAKLRPRTQWSRPMQVPRGSRLGLSLEGGEATVIVHDLAAATANVLLFDVEGHVRTMALASVTLPVRLGAALYFQPDPDTIARRGLDQADTVTWSISDITRRVRNASAPSATQLPNEGRGRFAGEAGRVVFVPWHGESILDYEHATELSRGLSTGAGKKSERRQAAQGRERWREVARSVEPMLRHTGAHLQLEECDSRRGWELKATLSGGKELLLVDLLTTIVNHRLNQSLDEFVEQTGGGGSLSGVGMMRLRGSLSPTDVTAALGFLESHGVPLAESADFWIEWYKQLCDSDDEDESPTADPLDRPAECLLLWAVLDAVATPSSGEPLADKVERWKARDPVLSDIERALDALNVVPDRAQALPDRLLIVLAWLFTRRFRAASAPLWNKLVRELYRAGDLSNDVTHLGDPLRWIAGCDAEARTKIRAQLKPLLALEAADRDVRALMDQLKR